MADLRTGTFRIEGSDAEFEGFTDGSTWNGFANPWFDAETTRKVVDVIVAVTREGGESAEVEYTDGKFTIVTEDGTEEFVAGEDGLFGFGWGWCWYERGVHYDDVAV